MFPLRAYEQHTKRILNVSPASSLADWKRNLREARSVGAPYELLWSAGNGIYPAQVPESSIRELKLVLRSYRAFLKKSPLGDSDKFIYQCNKVLLELFKIYGFDFSRFDREEMLTSILNTHRDVYLAKNWMQYFKYKIAAFFSAMVKQEIPKKKFPGLSCPSALFGGHFYKWVARMKRDRMRLWSFAVSVLLSKKGMPRPTDDMVWEAMKEHQEFMTRVPNPPLSTTFTLPNGSNYTLTKQEVCNECQDSTLELFAPFKFSLSKVIKAFIPSFSANISKKRSDYGTWPVLDEFINDVGLSGTLPEDLLTDLLQNETVPISELYGLQGYWDELPQSIQRYGLATKDQLKIPFLRVYWNAYSRALVEEPIVRVVGLKEALKIRPISKGPPLHYYVLKPFQLYMFKVLRKYEVFQLIGEPVTETIINRLYKWLEPNEHVESGDFVTTTDRIYSWVSDSIANHLFDIWEAQCGHSLSGFRRLFLEALTGHTYQTLIRKKDELIQIIQGGRQLIGQLMGSVISFCVLCIANLVLTRLSLRYSENCNKPISKLPTQINGDDVATIVKNDFYIEIWRAIGNLMGLEESVGKTYRSRDFLSINSRFFLRTEDDYFVQVPFVNMGIVNGMKRSSSEEGKEGDVFKLGQNYRELIRDSYPFCQHASELFLYNNGHILETYSGPWHLPVYLGGLGMGHKEPTKMDRKVALALRKYYNQGLLEVPTVTSDNEVILDNLVQNWVASNNPLYAKFPLSSYQHESSRGTAYASICYMLWMQYGLPIFMRDSSKVYNHCKSVNARTYQYAWRKIFNGQMEGKQYGKVPLYEMEQESKTYKYILHEYPLKRI